MRFRLADIDEQRPSGRCPRPRRDALRRHPVGGHFIGRRERHDSSLIAFPSERWRRLIPLAFITERQEREMSTTPRTFVMIGAGLAGTAASEALRTEGFDGRIVMLGNEHSYPYDRPPLSKDYLQGKSERDKIFLHPDAWYAQQQIELRLGVQVTALDRSNRQVRIEGGERIGYDKLLLATGSTPRYLDVPGAELGNVLYLRRVDDCEAMQTALIAANRVVIIGAGWIGLEVAAAARATGCEVAVVERGELPLLRVLGREMAEVYAALHRAHGVELRLGATLATITGENGKATGILLSDGMQIEADVVVVGVGITPNTALAEAAGLTVEDGVLVDEHLVTSDPDVFAAGDVANVYYPHLGTHLRLEHWSAALNQGPVAAANMVGKDTLYDQVPYFFSDQYEMGMEYSGYVGADGYDEVVFRGEVDTGEYLAFWLRDGRVRAGMNVNVWDRTDTIAALVRSGVRVDRARLVNPDVDLADVYPPR
jgi:3-phenylpropionate/trans-cinnamate dioxygenase ferredoxin reductase subunit